MKWWNLTKFFLVIVVALTAAYFLAEPIQDSINLGLDLQGELTWSWNWWIPRRRRWMKELFWGF